MSDFTDEEKMICAEREVRMRKRVYPHYIDSGKMDADKARKEIGIMEAIAEDYRKKVKPGLFETPPPAGDEPAQQKGNEP